MTFQEEVNEFRDEFLNDSPTIIVQTSGSTGVPKVMTVSKEKMFNSARATIDFLQILPTDVALLCMPVKYIAGKMMVVRSIVNNMRLEVVEPCGNPLKNVNFEVDFLAVTPMQVYNILCDNITRNRLQKIKNVIIGGGAIDEKMEAALREFPNNIYLTYGMTETLSHIAVRKISGKDHTDFYRPFPDVEITISDKGTIVVNAPKVCDTTLDTNDIGELVEGGFVIRGRLDNVVNSGGVKIQIEEIEAQLKAHISCPFAFTSVADEKFGEALVLLVETPDITAIAEVCEQQLDKIKRPKKIVTAKVPLTETNKIDRKKAKEIAKKLLSS